MEKENKNPKIRKQTPTKKTNLDLNEIKELESLKEIGCIDFETSSFNFGTDISIPDFSTSFSDISSGFSGSSSSFGGDF